MRITIGTHSGSHEITALHGKGGMGEVYRARDTKLKREVGIKILPEEFSRDADRGSCFQREVDVLASLNHPNIAGIYDLQEANSYPYLVLELVEGKTLADRIARGAIPVEDSLKIPQSICKALEAAHEKGIVHRDLKPANVKIIRAGNVKVRDFGLAKALERIRYKSYRILQRCSAPLQESSSRGPWEVRCFRPSATCCSRAMIRSWRKK